MDKADKVQAALAVPDMGDKAEKKFTLSITSSVALKCIFCVMMCFTSVFSDMRPFSLAFYGATFSINGWIGGLIASSVGYIIADAASAWVYIAALVMTTVIYAAVEKLSNIFRRALSCSGLFFVFKMASFVYAGFVLFDFFAAVLETIILFGAMIVVYHGYSLLISPGKRTFVSSFERMCTFAFATLLILSLHRITIYGTINAAMITAVLYTYILCLSATAENAVIFGIIMGVAVAMNHHPDCDVAGTFAFGALLGTVFKKYGKPGVIFGFMLASTAFSLLISDYSRIYAGIGESLSAAIVFMFLPGRVTSHFSSVFSKASVSCDDSSLRQQIRKDGFSSLRQMSGSFRELSTIYLSCAKEKKIGKTYMTSKLAQVADKVCAFCPSRRKCFDFGDKAAGDAMTSMLKKALSTDKLKVSDIPSPIKDICHRKDSFIDAFNSMTEVIKTDKTWLNKINESRRLVSDQLSGVADAIDKICEEESMQLNPDLEESIRVELDKKTVYPQSVSAYTDIRGDFCIYVSFKDGYVVPKYKEIIEQCIDSVVYAKSRFVSASRNANEITYLYCPVQKYTASFGYASKAKHGEKISGDSFNVIAPDKKRIVMALSDGMGSGSEAKTESETAIGLLEKFLCAGFDSDTAVRLINSSLLLKSSRDSFATVDICNINLSEHCLTFTKLGAANAYIKSDGKITVVRGSSLPAGILREIEIEKHMLPIKSDTVVVLVSDGVGDIAIKSKESEGWIESELQKLSTKNPQVIAAKLIEAAYKLENKMPSDDMTVLVAYIYENNSEV